MSVVANMLSINVPIYTVHDNFITTVQNSNSIPLIYSSVFRNMGTPLSIINNFIYMNVINPYYSGYSDRLIESKYDNMVIPKDMLHFYLKAYVPENISKNMRASWEERISGILTSYENYTRYVCGDFKSTVDCWQAHEEKCNKFKLKLRSGEGIPYYCVHY